MSTQAEQGTVEAFLEVARRNLGFVEGRNNANPYAGVAGHANNQPWCATFVVACARRAGVKLANESAYTPTMSNGFKAQKRWHTSPKIGDVAFYQWPSMGRIAHCGIVEAVHTSGTITAIEGNTDSAGGRTGGRVMRQVRRANIVGYGRPVFLPSVMPTNNPTPLLKKGDVGARVSDVQRALYKRRYLSTKAEIDGTFGPATEAALSLMQREFGLGVTGTVTVETWLALRRVAHSS